MQLRTPTQQEVVNRLVNAFGIDGRDVLFLNQKEPNRPWLRAKALASIARSSGKFKVVRSEFEQYIEPLRQVVYQGTLVDLDDRIYSLPGVATVGEKIEIDGSEESVNEHDLAESRSLHSTFELAGFDPFDAATVVPLGDFNPKPRDAAAAEAESRRADLSRIHILAKQKRLIVEVAGGPDDATEYRKFLLKRYHINTAAGFDALERKSLIEALERYVVDEFAELEGAAV